jgi:hypothetical protein
LTEQPETSRAAKLAAEINTLRKAELPSINEPSSLLINGIFSDTFSSL